MWDDEEVIRECDHCGEVKSCRSGPDPFAWEIYEEVTDESWWCDDCAWERRSQI